MAIETKNDKQLWERIYDSWGTDTTDAERLTWLPRNMSPSHLEALQQLAYPTGDGNVISKALRTELADMGLVDRWNGLNFCNRNGYAALMLLGMIRDTSAFTGWNGSNNKKPR